MRMSHGMHGHTLTLVVLPPCFLLTVWQGLLLTLPASFLPAVRKRLLLTLPPSSSPQYGKDL